MSRERGVFVVFEGVEGAGKSTQASRLSRRLERHGVAHELAREPGGTEAGERIRSLVLDPEVAVSDETELLLMLAARAELVRRVVEPALSRGEVVVADRYELSTFAYQGVARGLGLQRVRDLNRFATGGLEADLTIVLEVGPEEARRRRDDDAADRVEKAGDAFHRRVADAYARLAAPDDRIVTVEGAGPEAEVEARVADELGTRWPGVFPPADG